MSKIAVKYAKFVPHLKDHFNDDFILEWRTINETDIIENDWKILDKETFEELISQNQEKHKQFLERRYQEFLKRQEITIRLEQLKSN